MSIVTNRGLSLCLLGIPFLLQRSTGEQFNEIVAVIGMELVLRDALDPIVLRYPLNEGVVRDLHIQHKLSPFLYSMAVNIPRHESHGSK